MNTSPSPLNTGNAVVITLTKSQRTSNSCNCEKE